LSRAGLLAIAAAWLGRPGAAERARAALAGSAQRPAEFAAEARSQRIAAIVLEAAGQLGAPEPAVGELRAAVRGEAARALVLESAAAELAQAARAGNLAAVLVKGPALARRYGGRSLRPFGDLDLLVAPGSLPGWEQCLGALGYAPMPRGDRTWRRGALEWVDLHAKSSDLVGVIDVPEGLSPVRLDLPGMFARAEQPEGLPFPALSAEDELILAAGHGLGVHVFEKLVWLLDVAVLAAQVRDPGRLLELAGSSGAGRLLGHALEIARRLDLAEPPEGLLGALRPARTGRLERRLVARLIRGGLPDRAQFLLALALPAPRGYKRTLLGRACLPRRRVLETPALGRGPLGGALRHAGRLVRLGALALFG